MFERGDEGTVAMESTLERQLLCGEFTPVGHRLLIKTDKVADAKAAYVGVIGDALICKVLAQISSVCADDSCQLRQGKVFLQIELFVLAMLFEKGAYFGGSRR